MNKNSISQKHYGYLDFIRVFSMVMVIALHCFYMYYNDMSNAGRPFWAIMSFVNELTRTGVPLFFMISGFLLLNSDIPDTKTFYRKRFSKILIPFLLYDVFYYLAYSLNGNKAITIGRFLKELVNAGSAYHLWFIYSICFLYLMVPFVKKITDRTGPKMLVLFWLIAIFQTSLRPFVNTFSKGYFYFNITEDGIYGYLGYMILGYILGKYDLSKKSKAIVYLIGLLSFIITPVASMHRVATQGEFLFHGGYCINHYLEAAALFVLCKSFIKKDNKIISSMSKVTFSAYFIHVFVIEVLKQFNWEFSPSVRTIIWCGITVVASFLWGYAAMFITKFLKGVFKNVKKDNGGNSDNKFVA